MVACSCVPVRRLELRIESFDAFNDAQFFGARTVNSQTFGSVTTRHRRETRK
jgi:hypothetical protein